MRPRSEQHKERLSAALRINLRRRKAGKAALTKPAQKAEKHTMREDTPGADLRRPGS
jgi:hypothetical protein